jgi:hypothetical protein
MSRDLASICPDLVKIHEELRNLNTVVNGIAIKMEKTELQLKRILVRRNETNNIVEDDLNTPEQTDT